MVVKLLRSEKKYDDVMTKNVMEKIHKDLVPGIKKGTMRKVFDMATRMLMIQMGQRGPIGLHV